jgi:hypothetical protein
VTPRVAPCRPVSPALAGMGGIPHDACNATSMWVVGGNMTTSPPRARTARLVETRMVLDCSRNLWRISEMMAERTPGAPQAPCLVLSSENRYHRVWSYPADWTRRTIDELLPEPKPKPSAGPYFVATA